MEQNEGYKGFAQFEPIDKNHPLTRAARETNDYAEQSSLPEALRKIGIDIPIEQVFYLAQQRALRAFAATFYETNLGTMFSDPVLDEKLCQEMVKTPRWREYAPLMMACYMDGFAIGWKGHQNAEADAKKSD